MTYFVTANNTTCGNVVATVEDTTANVCITGNNNITVGINKILVSVTAENGNVRYYRVFLTCKEA